MNQLFADLHNHTTYSDGNYSPEQLLQLAAKKGIKAIAVTDHDTIAGLPDAHEHAKKNNIEFICGVEATVRIVNELFTGSLHFLLYFTIDKLKDKAFAIAINNCLSKGRGHALVEARVNAINEFFGPQSSSSVLHRKLECQEIEQYSKNVSRRHFYLALKEKHGIDNDDVITQLIGNASKAYIPSGIDMEDLHQFISKHNVLCIFAHPAAGSFPGESHYKEVLPPFESVMEMFPDFLSKDTLGIDGLEVYYPGHTPEHTEDLKKLAGKYNLCITGGSDCHDDTNRPPGVCGLSEEEFIAFRELLKKL